MAEKYRKEPKPPDLAQLVKPREEKLTEKLIQPAKPLAFNPGQFTMKRNRPKEKTAKEKEIAKWQRLIRAKLGKPKD